MYDFGVLGQERKGREGKGREGKGREGKDGKGGQITTMMIRRLMDDG